MKDLSDLLKEKNPFKRGRLFQEMVQKDYQKNSENDGEGVEIEKTLDYDKNVKRAKGTYGRMDILINDSDNNYVMIMEIKATIWDNIKPKNIKRNLWSHGRQLHKYIDKYIEEDNYNVGLALIYPKPPVKEGLREQIEKEAMDSHSFPVYWYSEL